MNRRWNRLLLFWAAAAALAPSSAFAWGGDGHRLVALLAIRSLPPGPLRMLLDANAEWFAAASSHPDRWRNRPDHAEGPRHFLDGERFGFGADLTRIPRAFVDVQKVRSYDQLRTDGMAPWTVARVQSLLTAALRERRWNDALVQAAYLSHYVADSHVPFHASENYDGQLSRPPQRGIHARFEERLLERTIRLADLTARAPHPSGDPLAETFATLQESISLVPAILAADRRAQALTEGTDSELYWSVFAARCRPIAIDRLETAGARLAGLLLSAWEAAGSPTPPRDLIASVDWLPYAPPFVPRGQPLPPAPPIVPDTRKAAARSRALTLSVPSRTLGAEVPCTLLLPTDYERSARRYPVLYLLHGASGNHRDWLDRSGLAAYVADLPLIVVLPDARGDSFYVDSRQTRWATFFSRDLRPFIERRYRTIARREGRALAGLSMGGYGAWKLALDHPRDFCAAASLSGALSFGDEPRTGPLARFTEPLFGDDDAAYREAALLPRIARLADGGRWRGPALWFDCGKDDFLAGANREMERQLLQKRLPYEFAEFNGAHHWEYWDTHLRDVLNFVLRHVAPAR